MTGIKAQQDAEKSAALMSEPDLATVIRGAIDAGATNIGTVMNVLKTNHASQYDGAVASRLAREALTAT